jgi:hypothetical protein
MTELADAGRCRYVRNMSTGFGRTESAWLAAALFAGIVLAFLPSAFAQAQADAVPLLPNRNSTAANAAGDYFPPEAVFSVRVRGASEFEPVTLGRNATGSVFFDVELDTRGLTNGVKAISFNILWPRGMKMIMPESPILDDNTGENVDFFRDLDLTEESYTSTNVFRNFSGRTPPVRTIGPVARLVCEFDLSSYAPGEFAIWEITDGKVYENYYRPIRLPTTGRAVGGLIVTEKQITTGVGNPILRMQCHTNLAGRVVPNLYVGFHDNQYALQRLDGGLAAGTWRTLFVAPPSDAYTENSGFVYRDYEAPFHSALFYRLQLTNGVTAFP